MTTGAQRPNVKPESLEKYKPYLSEELVSQKPDLLHVIAGLYRDQTSAAELEYAHDRGSLHHHAAGREADALSGALCPATDTDGIGPTRPRRGDGRAPHADAFPSGYRRRRAHCRFLARSDGLQRSHARATDGARC